MPKKENGTQENIIEYEQFVSQFIHSVFPLISNQSANHIASRAQINYDAKQEAILEKLGLEIYDLLVLEAETKLNNYIKVICSKVGISIQDHEVKIPGLSNIRFDNPQTEFSKTSSNANFVDGWRRTVDTTPTSGKYWKDEWNTPKDRHSLMSTSATASNFWSDEGKTEGDLRSGASFGSSPSLINNIQEIKESIGSGEKIKVVVTQEEEIEEDYENCEKEEKLCESPRFSEVKTASFDENFFGDPFENDSEKSLSIAREIRKDYEEIIKEDEEEKCQGGDFSPLSIVSFRKLHKFDEGIDAIEAINLGEGKEKISSRGSGGSGVVIPKLKFPVRPVEKLDVKLLAIKHKKDKQYLRNMRELPRPSEFLIPDKKGGACCGVNSCNIF